MQSPFSQQFAKIVIQGSAVNSSTRETTQELAQLSQINLGVRDQEEVISRKVDNFIAQRGVRPIKWASLTFTLTIIYTVLVMMCCMARADSLNITVCCIAIYLLLHTSEVSKKSFRALVLLTLLSLIYDFVWYFLQNQNEIEYLDGGSTSSLTYIAQWLQFLLLFFKIVMIFVYWKASIDFAAILDEKSNFQFL